MYSELIGRRRRTRRRRHQRPNRKYQATITNRYTAACEGIRKSDETTTTTKNIMKPCKKALMIKTIIMCSHIVCISCPVVKFGRQQRSEKHVKELRNYNNDNNCTVRLENSSMNNECCWRLRVTTTENNCILLFFVQHAKKMLATAQHEHCTYNPKISHIVMNLIPRTQSTRILKSSNIQFYILRNPKI